MNDTLLFFTGAFVFALMVIGVTFTIFEFRQLAEKDGQRKPDRHNERDAD
ncbi:MAG: hypothetical protein HKN15_00565 [Xanthomonadales bacterium]|nr:hypothetical protein [Xanthomonadales bacterium]